MPTPIQNYITQPVGYGSAISYYQDMVGLMADGHVYPKDDYYIASVLSPASFTLTGSTGPGGTVHIFVNGTDFGTATANVTTGLWTIPITLIKNETNLGVNVITGSYSYVDGGSTITGSFASVTTICNDIHLFLYAFAHQFQNIDTELNAISTDADLALTRDERLDEVWGNKLGFHYSDTFTYAQYRTILEGLIQVYLRGSTLENLLNAIVLITGSDDAKIYEYWKDASKMVANPVAYWEWNDLDSTWNGTTKRWFDMKVSQGLGLTSFGCQIIFPLDNYFADINYVLEAVELTRLEHLIYAIVFLIKTSFATPNNSITYDLTTP